MSSINGSLPEPLSVRTMLAAAIAAAVVLSGFGHTLPGLVIGLLLAAAVWYIETVETLTSDACALARESRLSISYIGGLCVGFLTLYARRTDDLVWLEWTCLGVLANAG